MSTTARTRHETLARDELRTLAKGLAVIEAFDAEHPSLTLSETARRVGISPGSAQRILRTLESLGYVGSDGARYALRPRTLQLGYAFLATLPLSAIAQPLLSSLTARLDASASLALLDGAEVVYVARASARRLSRDYMSVGTRMPAHATSVGKVLLAALPPEALEAALAVPSQRLTPNTLARGEDIRAAVARAARDGHALNDQETIMGLRSIAVPVAVGGQVVAALGASAEVARTGLGTMETEWLPELRATAAAFAAALSAREPPPYRYGS
ncbi:IclR family transcriptional regulator C-terminal domain-containing protein [Roseomonas sp. AR75]|uniref:IclR family transcriptional regulator domain-containing protein n=1 Tax=Roseomonas sp. AR75 TaxID=2562311 RepID=UPI001485BB2E|nr:IclR family transcriptional regulator C-terminal domain-containing protein [Roseomonas sp. AR75]